MKLLKKIKEILSAIGQCMYDIWFVLFCDDEDDANVQQDHCVLGYQSNVMRFIFLLLMLCPANQAFNAMGNFLFRHGDDKLSQVIVKNHKHLVHAASQLTDPVQREPDLAGNFLAKESWDTQSAHTFSRSIIRLKEIKTELSKHYSPRYLQFAANIRSHGLGSGMDWLQAPHYKGRVFNLVDKRLSHEAYHQVRCSAAMKHNFFHMLQIVLLLHDALSSEPFLQSCQQVRLEKFFWAAFVFYRLQDDTRYYTYMQKTALPFLEKYQEEMNKKGYQSMHLGTKEYDVQKRLFPKNSRHLSIDEFVEQCRQACKSATENIKKQYASVCVHGSGHVFGNAQGGKAT